MVQNCEFHDLTTQDLVTGKILPWNPYPSGNAYLCIGNFGFKPFFLSGGWCLKGAYYGNNMMLIFLMKISGKEATYCCPKEHCPYKRKTNVTTGEGVTKNGFKAHLKHQDAHNFKDVTFDKYTKIVAVLFSSHYLYLALCQSHTENVVVNLSQRLITHLNKAKAISAKLFE